MVKVKGALTGKEMSVPKDSIGLIMECKKAEFEDELYDDYPEVFTRIYLKEPVDGIKYIDCVVPKKELEPAYLVLMIMAGVALSLFIILNH